MTIDEALYLTATVDRSDDTTVYVHSAPLGRDAFDRYWKPLSRVYDDIMMERRFYSAPKVAVKMLRDVATGMGVWDGPMVVENGLMSELRRLTNVMAPANGSWQMIPYADALREKLIDVDDAEAIEGLLVFFTVVWRTAPKHTRREFVSTGAALCDAQTSSLSLSEFAASLPTLSGTVNIGEIRPAASLPPSSTMPPDQASKTFSTSVQTNFPGSQPPNIVIAS